MSDGVDKLLKIAEAASRCCVFGVGVQNRDMTHPLSAEQFGKAVAAYDDLHKALRDAGFAEQFEGHPSESSRPSAHRLGSLPFKHA